MRFTFLFLLVYGFMNNAIAQTASLQWATAFGGVTNDYGKAIAVDAGGNVYVTGSFASSTDFDPGPGVYIRTTVNHSDIFISKFDKNGNFVWARTVGSEGADDGIAIAIDSKGDVIYAAHFAAPIDADPGPGTDSLFTGGFYNGSGYYISKLDANGNFLWVKQVPTLNSFVLDASDNIILTGQFVGLTDFDPGPQQHNLNSVPPTGNQTYTTDAFVLKLDKNGSFVWAKAMGGGSYEFGMSVSVDAAGNVITTGTYKETADFDPGPGIYNLTSQGWTDVFVSKLDASGNFVWAKSLGGTSEDFSRSLVTDSKGDIYVCGYFYGLADHDPGPGIFNLPINGYASDIFITKLDETGNLLWANSFGSTTDDLALALALDVAGNVYATGGFSGTVDFDPCANVFNVTSEGYRDIFLLKLNPSGNFIWCVAQGSNINYDFAAAIAVDLSGNVYTTGHFWGTVDFDPGPTQSNLTMNGYGDVFIQKLGQCPLVSYKTIETLACKSYLINGQTYTKTGTYRQVLTNMYNCDSIITLKLTIGGSSSYDTISACESYVWQGHNYSASGDYSARFMDISGCDSILHINLSIKHKTLTTVDTTLCEGENYLGYSNAGVYIDTFHLINRCDSIRTLRLNFKKRSYTRIDVAICEGERFLNYTTGGTYTDKLKAANGCDSIRTLHLTVHPKKTTNRTVSICEGQYYYVQHANQTEAGIYKDTLISSSGCDSIIITNLVVNPRPHPYLGTDRDLCEGTSVTLSPGNFIGYKWSDQSAAATFLAKSTGVYFVTVTDQHNCSASDTLLIKNILPPPANFLKPVDSICQYEKLRISSKKTFNSYLWSTGSTASNLIVEKPGTYQLEVRDFNGCVGKENITVFPRGCMEGFYIPNAFTPNNDGKNDVFRPLLFGNVKSYQFIVYDRWGQIVFRSTELDKAWDGTASGIAQNTNIFIWTCAYSFEGEDVKTQKGTVTLIR